VLAVHFLVFAPFSYSFFIFLVCSFSKIFLFLDYPTTLLLSILILYDHTCLLALVMIQTVFNIRFLFQNLFYLCWYFIIYHPHYIQRKHWQQRFKSIKTITELVINTWKYILTDNKQ
jgi:hypothetical protein